VYMAVLLFVNLGMSTLACAEGIKITRNLICMAWFAGQCRT